MNRNAQNQTRELIPSVLINAHDYRSWNEAKKIQETRFSPLNQRKNKQEKNLR